jgi:hypothetical protein
MTPAEARQELLSKSLSKIHEEKSLGWMALALEAKQLFDETGDVKWIATCADTAHEAIEHAAMGETPGFLEAIRAKLRAGGAG